MITYQCRQTNDYLLVIRGGMCDYYQPRIQLPDRELDQQKITHMKWLST